MAEKPKPLMIQIDDEVREMTPEEVTAYEESIAGYQPLPDSE